MRAVLLITLVLASVWAGFWAVARQQLMTAATEFVARQQELGGGGVAAVTGFPARIEVTISDLVMVDPASGIRVVSPFAQAYAPTWKPWDLSAVLPSGQELMLPDQVIRLESTLASARLLVQPGVVLAFRQAQIAGQEWRAVSDQGWDVAIGGVLAGLTFDKALADGTAHYRAQLAITDLTIDANLRAALTQTGLGGAVQDLHLNADVTLSAPIDRHFAENAPQVLSVDLDDAGVTWGRAGMILSGRLEAGTDGLGQGEIAVQVTHWRDFLAAALAMGLLTADQAGLSTKGLAALADPKTPDQLDIVITAKDGLMRFGPFPLGPAPRLNAGQGS